MSISLQMLYMLIITITLFAFALNSKAKVDISNKLYDLYILLMLFGLITFLFFNQLCNGLYLRDLLFTDYGDTGGDFFNFFYFGNYGEMNPYNENGKWPFLPPFYYLLIYIISRQIPTEFRNDLFNNWFRSADNDPRTISYTLVIYIVFILINFIVLSLIINNYNKQNKYKFLFTLITVTNFGMIQIIDRGNPIVISLVGLIIYIINYKSKSNVFKEMALIGLALAVSIKVYPVIFGILLIKNRDLQSAFRACLYGLLFYIIPFYYLGGVASGYSFIINIMNATSGISYLSFGQIINTLFQIINQEFTLNSYIFYTILGLNILYVIYSKVEWKTILMLCLIMIQFTGSSQNYVLSYFILPIILMFGEKNTLELNSLPILLLIINTMWLYPYPIENIININKVKIIGSDIINVKIISIQYSLMVLNIILIMQMLITKFEVIVPTLISKNNIKC